MRRNCRSVVMRPWRTNCRMALLLVGFSNAILGELSEHKFLCIRTFLPNLPNQRSRVITGTDLPAAIGRCRHVWMEICSRRIQEWLGNVQRKATLARGAEYGFVPDIRVGLASHRYPRTSDAPVHRKPPPNVKLFAGPLNRREQAMPLSP